MFSIAVNTDIITSPETVFLKQGIILCSTKFYFSSKLRCFCAIFMASSFNVVQNILLSLIVALNSLCANITSKPMGKCKTQMTIHPGKRRFFATYSDLALALSLQGLYQTFVWKRGNLEVINDVFPIDLVPLAIQNVKIACKEMLFLIQFQTDGLQYNKNNTPPEEF